MANCTVGFFIVPQRLFLTWFACRPPALVTEMKQIVKGGLTHRDICRAASYVFLCIQHSTETLEQRVKGESVVAAANADEKIRLFLDGYKFSKRLHMISCCCAFTELNKF